MAEEACTYVHTMGFHLMEETRGNMWAAKCSYALTISADGKKSRGMHQFFDWRFPFLFSSLRNANAKLGQFARFRPEKNKIVYGLVTKENENDSSSYQALETALNAIKHDLAKEGITELAIPRLGCGAADQLNWKRVREILCKVFEDSDMLITVYSPPFRRRFCDCCRRNGRTPDECKG